MYSLSLLLVGVVAVCEKDFFWSLLCIQFRDSLQGFFERSIEGSVDGFVDRSTERSIKGSLEGSLEGPIG